MGLQGNKSMGLVYIHVFGCRSSLCEGEFIAGSLQSLGHEITEDLTQDFNAAVVVTCSVTQEADRKCRSLVRKLRRILGNDGILAVCGCWSESLSVEKARELGIDILGGSKGKNLMPSAINDMLCHGRDFADIRKSLSQWEEIEISAPVMHTRSFMKIQDGCNHFCTYCIIPFLRGKPVSRPEKNILSEINRLIDNGTKEIIFTGIHLGIYGHDINTNLAELIKQVSKIDGLKRLRLGSIEPFCLSDDLIDALADCKSFCHHIHIPLQSGDDGILSSMRRGYNAREFLNVCCKLREKISDKIHISSDILVGFPGESDDAFKNTLSVMKEAGMGRVHVFPYSERPGTLAAEMNGKISHQVKISRTSEAISLGRKLYGDYAESFIGSEAEILIERDNRGYTRHYIEAECYGKNNDILKAEVKSFDDGRLKCLCRD